MTKFEENLKMAFSESLDDLCLQNHETDLLYQRLSEKYSNVYDLIQNKLSEEYQGLMLELEETQNAMNSIDADFIYLQGITDCVKLLKIIKMI